MLSQMSFHKIVTTADGWYILYKKQSTINDGLKWIYYMKNLLVIITPDFPE